MMNDGIGRSDSVSCGFLHLILRVPVILMRVRPGIATCVDSSLGSDISTTR